MYIEEGVMKERKGKGGTGEEWFIGLEGEASGEGSHVGGEGSSIEMPASKNAKIGDGENSVPSNDPVEDALELWYRADPRT